ncbi:MAG: hypothetical protein H5T33_06325 [Candidatus Methanosuratus sp.]|nr:hypothetical protein [Candidatus Methanosuratincola sp.]
MAALIMLAVQIYGAKELFHIILVDKDLAEQSYQKSKAPGPYETSDNITPGILQIKVCSHTIYRPFPPHRIVIAQGRDVSPDVKKLLIESGLLKNGSPTEIGKTVLIILESVESIPGPCPERATIDLRNHHHFKERERIAQQLVSRFNFICKMIDIR